MPRRSIPITLENGSPGDAGAVAAADVRAVDVSRASVGAVTVGMVAKGDVGSSEDVEGGREIFQRRPMG